MQTDSATSGASPRRKVHTGTMQGVAEQIAILIVHTDTALLSWIEQSFTNGYEIKTAPTPMAAFSIINCGFKPSIIISDAILGGQSSLDFLRELKEILPSALRVVATKKPDASTITQYINAAEIFRYITLPLAARELARQLEGVVARVKLDRASARVPTVDVHEFEQLYKQKTTLEFALSETNNASKKIQTQFRNVVTLLAELTNFKLNFYADNHALTVATMCRAVAAEMQYDERRIQRLELAAMLHDIGKISLAEQCIVTVPDLLPKEDEKQYRSHVLRGVELLENAGLDSEIIEIVRQHHENESGSGFPYSLSGRQILESSSILHIADIYHNRVYRIPSSMLSVIRSTKHSVNESPAETSYRQSQAISFLRRNSSWFKAPVLEAFLKVAEQGNCTPLQVGTHDNGKDVNLIDAITRKYISMQQ